MPMSDFPHFYPASPRHAPADLDEPSVPFRKQLNIVSFCLLLFFLAYFSLILLLLLGILYCLATSGRGNPGWAFGRWALIAGMAVPLVILIKNLFQKRQWTKGYEIEVTPRQHPDLFEFLECVCEETGAPMPDRVLINHEVNASVRPDVSLSSLFGSSRTTLVIGLGLVNVINMTEFKALLAHEFGHLSQFQMRSAPYVRVAITLVANILCATRIGGLDKALLSFFILVIKLNKALSREMEFHADLVAARVAGSDAVAQLLFKCYWADALFQQMMADLDMAREHKLYSSDVLLHQERAAKHLRQRGKDPQLGEPPRLPGDRERTFQLFQPEEDDQAQMWSDHPTNFERELNVKACYVRTDFDETSPWALFGDAAELRRRVSVQFYREVFNLRKDQGAWSGAAEVQAFLDEEYAETTFDAARYGTIYNHRNLEALDLHDLRAAAESSPHSLAELVTSHRSLYSEAVKTFGDVYRRHIDERQLLTAVANRWFRPKNDRFEMRGSKFHVRRARDMLRDIEKEIDADRAWLAEFDAVVFSTYFEMALQVGPEMAREMEQRYRFHLIMQGMWTALQEHKSPMDLMFRFVAGEGPMLNPQQFHTFIEVFRGAYEAVRLVLDEAELLSFPALANLPAGKPVRPFLLQGHLRGKPSHFDMSVSFKWLQGFARQFQDVEKRLNRLHFKSLGNILALQEAIAAKADKGAAPVAAKAEKTPETPWWQAP
jgi:Zn-dependent protease with chaperone function